MPDLTRRELIAAGATGAALATAGGIALAEELGSKSGAPRLPHDTTPAKFNLAAIKPHVLTEWGSVRECTVKNFPILAESDAAVFLLTMKPGALREPHWHPNAWEVDWVIDGKAELCVVNPDDTTQTVVLEPGDVGFIPQAWAHFIRNPGKTELKMVLTFGNNEPNDIGLSTMFAGMQTDAFTETLGLKKSGLDGADKPDKTLFFVS
jgi:oxalate decarboxylase